MIWYGILKRANIFLRRAGMVAPGQPTEASGFLCYEYIGTRHAYDTISQASYWILGRKTMNIS